MKFFALLYVLCFCQNVLAVNWTLKNNSKISQINSVSDGYAYAIVRITNAAVGYSVWTSIKFARANNMFSGLMRPISSTTQYTAILGVAINLVFSAVCILDPRSNQCTGSITDLFLKLAGI